MLHLRNVLQLIVDGLYDSPFPEKQLVGHAHQRSFHIALQLRYQLYPVHKKPLEELFLYIPFVSDKLPIYKLHK